MPNSTLEPIQDATLELRNGCAALEESLEQLFHELDEMRQELVDRLMAVEQERQRLNVHEADSNDQAGEAEQLRSELQRQADELARAREELARAKQELEQQRSDVPDARLADLEAELAEARRRLAEGEAGGGEAGGGEVADTDDSRCAVTMSVEQMSALEQERDALEAELEIVRNRAVELNETVAEQQREISEQKTELSGELSQLRRLVEKQAELFTTRDDLPEEVASGTEQPGKTPGANDPVVHSVMAQFAKLQKDVASRRRPR